LQTNKHKICLLKKIIQSKKVLVANGDAVTFKPNIDSPEKDCIKGIVAEVLENGYYNVTVGLTSFWGSQVKRKIFSCIAFLVQVTPIVP
jgi:hypothetical protein